MSFRERVQLAVTGQGKNKRGSTFTMTILEEETVSRTNKAKITFKVSVDVSKVKKQEEKLFASALSYWEEIGKNDGEKKPTLEEISKDIEDSIMFEMQEVSRKDLQIQPDGTLFLPNYELLKAEVLFQNRTINNVAEIDFDHVGEVGRVGEAEYTILI